MKTDLITVIQAKIRALKNEIIAIEFTTQMDKVGLPTESDARVKECVHKIQVLNEIIISYGVQKK